MLKIKGKCCKKRNKEKKECKIIQEKEEEKIIQEKEECKIIQEKKECKIIQEKEDNLCFICFDLQKEDEYPIEMKHHDLFIKNCNCNGFTHKSCLEVWYSASSKKCPICRTDLKSKVFEIENANYVEPINENKFHNTIIIIIFIYLYLLYKSIILLKEILFDTRLR